MGVELLIRYATNALFAILFAVVVIRALRARTRVWVETALFFGCATLLVADSWAFAELNLDDQRLLRAVNVSFIVTMAFLLVRLINNMSTISRSFMLGASVGFGVLIVASWAVDDANSPIVLLPIVVYFAVLVVFAAVVMASAGIRAGGVARRRMLAVALGSLFLSIAVVLAGVRAAFPDVAGISHSLIDGPLALAAGISYFVGFATPNFLRHSWQDRVIREFFSHTVTLSRVSDLTEVVLGLETAARRSLGALPVVLTLWDPSEQSLRSLTRSEVSQGDQPVRRLEERVFTRQRPAVSVDLQRDDPANADRYRMQDVNAVICAPVSVGEWRFGVLAVYSQRAPVFVDDDLTVVRLMADQAAIILEGHALIQQTTRLRAREEATRLKDDFLAAAAHDLSTPLTAVVMQAQLIERRLLRQPDTPPDPAAVHSLIDQANRLKSFVADLLDVQRLESHGLNLVRSDVDLSDLVSDAATRVPRSLHRVRLEIQRPVMVNCDRDRVGRLIENLLGNAVKYSPNGGEILIRLWSDGHEAHVTVRDQGIGISPEDLPYVFERFHRGSNTEGTALRGVGLGLFFSRAVAEAHGGTIAVKSVPGLESEFHVVLPVERDVLRDVPPGRQPPEVGRPNVDWPGAPADTRP